jgi:hypothetical protein
MAPKNILLMIADDLGKQLGCHGATKIQTPHVDQLASEGTKFQLAFAARLRAAPVARPFTRAFTLTKTGSTVWPMVGSISAHLITLRQPHPCFASMDT